MTAKQKRVVGLLVAFFFLGAAGFATGSALSWADEHGGIAGKAYVTHCNTSHFGKRVSVYCTARWTYNGRTVTGYVENAKANQEGKTISVRIHGTSHVTNTTYWVPIGLGLFALFELAVGVWMYVIYRRRLQAAT